MDLTVWLLAMFLLGIVSMGVFLAYPDAAAEFVKNNPGGPGAEGQGRRAKHSARASEPLTIHR